jgi:RNA polymerase sigma-70 factor (ECF subfamily)
MPVSETKGRTLSELDETELLVAVRARDERSHAAFKVIYERFRGKVLALLVPLLRDPDLAEDVLQEAFFRVYVTLDRYDPARPFLPWLYQIAHHAAIDALRLRGKHEHLRDAARRVAPVGAEATEDAAQREDRELAARALDHLPGDLKSLLVQRHALGMTLAELAESWSCAERTITTRLREAAGLFAQSLSMIRRRES